MNDSKDQTPEVIGVRRGMFGAQGTGDTSGYGRLVRSVALPGSTPRPYGGYFDDVVDRLAEVLGAQRYAVSIER
ncbi:NADH-quinone oxidoreductase subunit C, partial [Mycolicibacterium brisbanense]|nr:NADH-quinone oxidoreductase subunit C [Mycolicibacterium brisbanense]